VTRIAISYRRDDSAGISGRIFDRLVARYGADSVFRDIDNIPLGVDFREHINSVLAQTDITLVVVGKRWFGPLPRRRRRIDDPADPVRVEVETALRNGMPVVPVLVEGGAMPNVDRLPDSLSEFVYRNGLEVDSGRDFDQHIERLIRNMEPILARRTKELEEAAHQAEEEKQRPEAARQAEEEKQQAEAARQAEEEKQQAEAARQAEEEKQQAEAARQAEVEKQQAEAARQAEDEKRRVEAAREAEEEKRQAEAARQAEEEKQRAEAAWQAEEEKQRAEAARLAEEKRRAEAARLAEEERSADFALFSDAPFAPELVALPAGTFWMGSLEKEGFDVERPRHSVTIRQRFAIGRYPVTFAEYDHFCEAAGRQKPSDQGWGRGLRPVINVSRKDAQTYLAWLSQETGKAYRLPSEAEWEYACRAGTTTRYSFGDAITRSQVNAGDLNGIIGFRSSLISGRTSEVGTHPPNPWGLCDMHGNVAEWVEDDWHEDYRGAPDDGSVWRNKGTDLHSRFCVLRGGSWSNYPSGCRSACRNSIDTDHRGRYVGFRVARILS
jgi:formylglycine-generating enzyme required for sulfatase activity